MSQQGRIHLFTGNGKGKTTAALGIGLRATGHNMNVIMIQFMKGQETGEIAICKTLNQLFQIERFGLPQFITPNTSNKDIQKHINIFQKGIKRTLEIFESNIFDVIILDELALAPSQKIATTEEIISLIQKKPLNCELIITGRNAPDELIDLCDVVTEMKEIKHCYNEGINAIKGIDF